MQFSRKMCLKIILKVTKNQGFTISLEDTFFEKPQGGNGGQTGLIIPLPPHPMFSHFRVRYFSTDLFTL